MPRASVVTATVVKPGFFTRVRKAKRTSLGKDIGVEAFESRAGVTPRLLSA
jgi:hypothetical protein